MKEKNKQARNRLIARFVKVISVLCCVGTALSGIVYVWAEMQHMMSGIKTDTVRFSISEFINDISEKSAEKDVVN